MPEAPAAADVRASLREETGYVPSGNGHVYSFLCAPEGLAAGGVVILGPLAEEKKSSLRALVETARALAREAGLAALRIDFRGTGDSSGRSEGATLDTMAEDAVSASDWLSERLGRARVSLLGLRLGAAVAVLAAERAAPSRLVLVEPVVDGAAYVRELERQRAIRRMLTRGSGARAAEGEEGPFDLDGLALGRGFLGELARLDLVERARVLAAKASPRALVLQVGAPKALRRELASLAQALGGAASAEAVVAEPFWLQTDYVDPAPAVERIVRFLSRPKSHGAPNERARKA
jgi:alpha/beta superfamily hydrolase